MNAGNKNHGHRYMSPSVWLSPRVTERGHTHWFSLGLSITWRLTVDIPTRELSPGRSNACLSTLPPVVGCFA